MLASQLRKKLPAGGILFAMFAAERHDNSNERHKHISKPGAGAEARAAMVTGRLGGTRGHLTRGSQCHRGGTAFAVRRDGFDVGGGIRVFSRRIIPTRWGQPVTRI